MASAKARKGQAISRIAASRFLVATFHVPSPRLADLLPQSLSGPNPGDSLPFSVPWSKEYRSQIRSVVYGIDQETPTLSMPVPSRTTGDLSWDEFAIAAPVSAEFATIQVTYIDGTKSEIVKLFRRK